MKTPVRVRPRVDLEQIDGDEVVVRITVTPERPADGPNLASDVLEAISNPTDGRLRPAR